MLNFEKFFENPIKSNENRIFLNFEEFVSEEVDPSAMPTMDTIEDPKTTQTKKEIGDIDKKLTDLKKKNKELELKKEMEKNKNLSK